MKKIWFLILAGLLLLSACSQGAQAGMPSESGGDLVEIVPAATATTAPTDVPPTVTPVPQTPIPSTAMVAPPTPTPTLMPVEILTDVPYIDDGNPLHRASIYLPSNAEGPYPTLVIYHSGLFWYGDMEYLKAYEELGRYFAGRGYAVVVSGYRLSQTDPYPAAVEDAFCTLAWTHATAADYGFDATRVATLGLDAGADLAALTGAVDDPKRFLEGCPYPLPTQPMLQGVVAIGGYYDLPALFVPTHAFGEMFQQYIAYYLEGTPEEAPERYAEASPITWVDGSEPPFAVIYNRYDNHFTHNQALPFAETLESNGVQVQVIQVGFDFGLLIPYSEAFHTSGVLLPTLDDYGFPQADAFLAALFGMPR